MKKRLLNLICLFIIWITFWWFYIINNKNYLKLNQIDLEFVKHPELLPKKEIVKYTSMWYSNLRAWIYWLETIQYIWWNAISSEYKKYLFSMLDLITELNPYFEKPYIIWQLLLPEYNERYENLSKKQQNLNTKQAEIIWLKWIKNFCDAQKLAMIKKEDDLKKLWSNKEYKNPCKTAEIPSWQAFLYYFHLKNTKESATYYKIASTNDDSLEWNKIMVAIMSGKSWEREKSIMMFLTLAKANDAKENEKCQIFSRELQKISFMIYREKKELHSEIIKNLEILRVKNYTFNEEEEAKNVIAGNNCNNYMNKAIRELNLQYIENGNKKFFEKNNKNADNAKILFQQWFIDFLPTDFQQYDDYWIIYYYNTETWNFDYKMWKY